MRGCEVVPLTEFQRRLLADLAVTQADDRYLAGGAAMHFAANSTRYSDDLDFFHDSEERVAKAFARDRETLDRAGYSVDVHLTLPGFVRAVVGREGATTRVDWAHDSAWRFMPLQRDDLGGLLLHPVDLAVNKVLALAGRDEPRDFVDILFVHRSMLPLPAACWAAVGKDLGLTPLSLLELLRRRGRYRTEDFERLNLVDRFDLVQAKETWLAALTEVDAFVRERPQEEYGCLYYSAREHGFVLPKSEVSLAEQDVVAHFGKPGGVLPRVVTNRTGSDTASFTQ